VAGVALAEVVDGWGETALRLEQRLRHRGDTDCTPELMLGLTQLRVECGEVAIKLHQEPRATWPGAGRCWQDSVSLPGPWSVHRVMTRTAAGLHEAHVHASRAGLDAERTLEALAARAQGLAAMAGPALVMDWS
jgi:hypothetical protein